MVVVVKEEIKGGKTGTPPRPPKCVRQTTSPRRCQPPTAFTSLSDRRVRTHQLSQPDDPVAAHQSPEPLCLSESGINARCSLGVAPPTRLGSASDRHATCSACAHLPNRRPRGPMHDGATVGTGNIPPTATSAAMARPTTTVPSMPHAYSHFCTRYCSQGVCSSDPLRRHLDLHPHKARMRDILCIYAPRICAYALGDRADSHSV